MKLDIGCEVMMAGWSETHNGGAKITLWLANTEDLEPFKALTVAKGNTAGQRFMLGLVEIGDDEQPKIKNQKQKEKAGPLCMLACQWCKDPQFWQFLKSHFQDVISDVSFKNIDNEDRAADFIKYHLNIESRKDLDLNDVKDLFNLEIRQPYMAFPKYIK